MTSFSVAVPLMHILAIHMNTMNIDLSDDWNFLTGNFDNIMRESQKVRAFATHQLSYFIFLFVDFDADARKFVSKS